MLQALLGRFLDWTVGDGISSELSTAGDHDNFTSYCQRTDFSHFLELTPKNVNTRKLDEIIASPILQERMDSYFNDKIDMFPYEGSTSALASTTKSATVAGSDNSEPAPHPPTDETPSETARNGVGIIKPDRFYTIQAAMIERRFPGGRERDIGDGDLRDQISSMRYIFAWNYWQLIIARRGWTLLEAVALVLVALICIWLLRNSSLIPDITDAPLIRTPAFFQAVITAIILLFLNAASVIAYFLLQRRHSTLTDRYKNAVSKSAAVLRTSVDSRLRGIVDAMPDIFKQGEAAKQQLKDAKSLSLWPHEGRKWPVLGVWMAKRVEHIELFMQLEMWRIRRIHYGLRVLARWLSCLLFVLALLVFALVLFALHASGLVILERELTKFVAVLLALSLVAGVASISNPRWIAARSGRALFAISAVALPLLLAIGHLSDLLDIRDDAATVLAIVSVIGALVWISKLSFTAAIPDLNLIETTLLSAQLRGHHDTRVHTEMAELVYRLMGAVLHAEDTRRN
jgi:hypothetical protein